jgi:hypothetical protein
MEFCFLFCGFYPFMSIFKGSSKNVIPAEAGIQNQSKLLDSRLRESDKLGIIRGTLKAEMYSLSSSG